MTFNQLLQNSSGYWVVIFLSIFSLLTKSFLIENNSVTLNDLLLWGTYKPYLISSVTQRSDHPITIGMAFSKNFLPKPSFEDFQRSLKFRINEGVFSQYTHHNGFDFSRQVILDDSIGFYYDSTFLKNVLKSSSSHSAPIQEWNYVIESNKLDNDGSNGLKQPYSTFLYVALENLGIDHQDFRSIEILDNGQSDGNSIVLKIWNTETDVLSGYIKIKFSLKEQKEDYLLKSNKMNIYHCLASGYNKTDTWKVEDIIFEKLSTDLFKSISILDPKKCQGDFKSKESNFFVLQVISEDPIQAVVSYSSVTVPSDIDYQFLKDLIYSREKQFEENLKSKLPIRNLNKYKYNIEEAKEIQKSLLSNLLGRMVYSRYFQETKSFSQENIIKEEDLFAILPSRTNFTQTFFNQEGFDLAVLCRWNNSLCIELIRNQLEKVQETGNSKSFIYSNEFQHIFQTKTPTEPTNNIISPSLVLSLKYLLDQLIKSQNLLEKNYSLRTIQEIKETKEFLLQIQPKLEIWFWELENQTSILKNIENPRLFLDLLCLPNISNDSLKVCFLEFRTWLAVISKVILDIGKLDENLELQKNLKSIQNYLESTYHQNQFMLLETHDYKNYKSQLGINESILLEKSFPCFEKQSDLSLLFDDSLKLNTSNTIALIKLITSPKSFWSTYGIMSSCIDNLSLKESSLCTNIIELDFNYLVLRGLKKLLKNNHEIQELYEALRENLLKTISLNWELTHKFWAGFDSSTGLGKKSCRREGFYSLITLIYSEEY